MRKRNGRTVGETWLFELPKSMKPEPKDKKEKDTKKCKDFHRHL